MTEIKRSTKRDDLVALRKKLQLRADWHEPDEREVTAIPYGYDFDNAGHWGTDTRFEMERQGRAGSVERYVVIFQDGKPAAEVNLATLFAFATGFEG